MLDSPSNYGAQSVPPAALYCRRFLESGLEPRDFAHKMILMWPSFVVAVLEDIGSWESSEPELAALQAVWR